MQQTTIVDNQRGFKAAPRVKPTLRVFIACEDKASFLRARRVQRKVEEACRDDIRILPMYWAFALLRHDGLRECAAKEAGSAEMVVVSFRGTAELPPHVKCWLEGLPTKTQSGQAALVALVKFPEGWSASQSEVNYMRQIAENRGMDFFCNREETSESFNFEMPPKSQSLFAGIGKRSVTPANMFPFQFQGGLND